MVQNIQFGGGADASSITPWVLAITVIVALLILVLPRKYILAPVIVAVFLTPFGQQVLLGGFHFFLLRIFVVVGAIRMLGTAVLTQKLPIQGGINTYDKVFFWWATVRGLAAILLYRELGAVVNQAGLWVDAFGAYFLVRYALQDEEDILRALKVFAAVAGVLAACMLYESQTRINVFSNLAGHTIVPWLRNGRVRAQGVSGNSITAGAIGAALMPLFFWLWKSRKARLWGAIGLPAAGIIALTSMASTPISGFLGGILALCAWPIRRYMRLVRWGMVFAVLGLSLVMKAPVWYVITKVNVVGGDSWDRANLIDQTVRHFSDWWLWGTKDNANWGDFTWDQCNQFAAEGLQGGLATLVLFFMTISRAFSRIGLCRKHFESELKEWHFWCLGSALFAHIITFMGIDYFDQTRTLWFIFLAMISAATAPVLAAKTAEELPAAPLPLRPAPYSLSPSSRSTLKGLSLKSSRQSRP